MKNTLIMSTGSEEQLLEMIKRFYFSTRNFTISKGKLFNADGKQMTNVIVVIKKNRFRLEQTYN